MTAPHFRLRFHLPQGYCIDCDEPELVIPTNGDQANLRMKGDGADGTIKSTRRLVLSGGPYKSEAKARAAGSRARNALMRYAIQSRVGIDLGKDRSTGGISKYLKNKIASELGVQVLNDVHGLMVYDAALETRFADCRASGVVRKQVREFLEVFQHTNASQFEPTEEQELAFELFAAAYFQPSPRTRFLTLVMGIEALLHPTDRDQAARAHVQLLIDQTKQSALSKEDKDPLLGALRGLCKNSIGRTGGLLAGALLAGNKYGGQEPGKFFRRCYELRGALVHDGKFADDPVLLTELERFVADLLEASIRPIPT